MKLEGRCLCRKIQFEIAGPTASSGHCHCESCRRAHSAAFVTWTSFTADGLHYRSGSELVKQYESSPGIFRSFCFNCGTPLFYKAVEEPETMYVPTAALTTLPDYSPTRHVSFEEKVPWLDIKDTLPKYHSKDQLIG